jgi:hypothetical protein
MEVLTSVPTHTTEEGSALLYASGAVRRFYAYINGQWNYWGFVDAAGKILVDGEIEIGSTLKADGTSGLWLGHGTYASAPFRVSLAGALVATSATITGTVTATAGTIGGWDIAASTLSSAANKVILDDTNEKITVGDTGATYLVIDGANTKIESSDYSSGATGGGFHLSAALLETSNIACRGILRHAVFQKTTISSVGGNLLIIPSDVLDTDMTALDASTLTIEGNETFAVGDFLRIKDDTEDEWLEVTNIASAPTYTVTRDKNSSYGADSNPAWKKGASVVNYGASGSGGILLSASESNPPRVSIYKHAGAPWTTITEVCRLGNLNGFLGYSSELYGIAIGETNKFLKYDPTNGLKIQATEIKLLAGTDIIMVGDDSDPSKIVFQGTDHTCRIELDGAGDNQSWEPETTDTTNLTLGTTSNKWNHISITSLDQTLVRAVYDGSCRGDYYIYATGSVAEMQWILQDASNFRTMRFYFDSGTYEWFGPTTLKTIDLATTGGAFDDAYADDWNNVADFPHLDTYDDLQAIKSIKDSNKVDPRTGFPLIDDSTIPEWLLVKQKGDGYEVDLDGKVIRTWKKGDVATTGDADNKPYLSLKTMISLLMGAVRQLDARIEALET